MTPEQNAVYAQMKLEGSRANWTAMERLRKQLVELQRTQDAV
jgi:hypothetical protein